MIVADTSQQNLFEYSGVGRIVDKSDLKKNCISFSQSCSDFIEDMSIFFQIYVIFENADANLIDISCLDHQA